MPRTAMVPDRGPALRGPGARTGRGTGQGDRIVILGEGHALSGGYPLRQIFSALVSLESAPRDITAEVPAFSCRRPSPLALAPAAGFTLVGVCCFCRHG